MDEHERQPQAFGPLLRRYRAAAGLTQEELAERAEVSIRCIGDLECGVNRAPRRGTFARLATALRLTSRQRDALDKTIVRRRGPRTAPSARRPDGPCLQCPAGHGLVPDHALEAPNHADGLADSAGRPGRARMSREERLAWALAHLRLAGPLSPRAYAAALSVDRKTARADLRALVGRGLVQVHGATTDRRYALCATPLHDRSSSCPRADHDLGKRGRRLGDSPSERAASRG